MRIFPTIIILLLQLLQGHYLIPLTFFEEDEVSHLSRHVREDSSAPKENKTQPCDEDTLLNFLAEIQVINPESIVELATFSELQPTCDKVSVNLAKTKEYLKTCQPPNQSDLYLQLIRGVESLHDKICVNAVFRKSLLEFQDIYKCVHELRNEFEGCSGPADWNENSDQKEVCRAYKDIADCHYIKTAKVCGKEAASTMKELLEAVADSILTVKCADVKKDPVVKDAMPDEYIKKSSGELIKTSDMLLALSLCMITYHYFTNIEKY